MTSFRLLTGAFLGAAVIAVLLLSGPYALRGSLTGPEPIEERVLSFADVNGDGLLYAAEARDALNKVVQGVAAGDMTMDVNGDGVLNNADGTVMVDALTMILSSTCGNGTIQASEQCDDLNKNENDGCTSMCFITPGYDCWLGLPSSCFPLCGNSKLNTGEQCDDGNDMSGDGCTPQCAIEQGFTCAGIPSICSQPSGSSETRMLYFVNAYEERKVDRFPLADVSRRATILSSYLLPGGTAIDTTAGKVYWTDMKSSRILRSNLDGSDTENVVMEGLLLPVGIAIDSAGRKMYWVEKGSPRIRRANLDGTGIEDLVTTGLVTPTGIALDVAGGKMYWTDGSPTTYFDMQASRKAYPSGTVKTIKRANLNGTSVESLISSGITAPEGIALDLTNRKMYWTDGIDGLISRANFDGSAMETIVTGLGAPDSVVVDPAAQKVYWVDRLGGKLQQSALDGTAVTTLLTTNDGPGFGALSLDTQSDSLIWGGWSYLAVISRVPLSAPQNISLVPTQLAIGTPSGPFPSLLGFSGNALYLSDGLSLLRTASDGSQREWLMSLYPYHYDLALDLTAGKLYWSSYGKIDRSNLDGSNAETVVSGIQTLTNVLPMALKDGKLYWIDAKWNTYYAIKRSNADGSNVETLLTIAVPPEPGSSWLYPLDLIVDDANQKFYWTTQTDALRANFDGTQMETIPWPAGVTMMLIDASQGHLYWGGKGVTRSNLDGSDATVLFQGSSYSLRSILLRE